MNPDELYNVIVKFCRSNSDEAIVKKYSRYFKNGVYDAYGLSQDLLNGKVKEILARKDVDPEIVRETSKLLIRSSKYEEPSFAPM